MERSDVLSQALGQYNTLQKETEITNYFNTPSLNGHIVNGNNLKQLREEEIRIQNVAKLREIVSSALSKASRILMHSIMIRDRHRKKHYKKSVSDRNFELLKERVFNDKWYSEQTISQMGYLVSNIKDIASFNEAKNYFENEFYLLHYTRKNLHYYTRLFDNELLELEQIEKEIQSAFDNPVLYRGGRRHTRKQKQNRNRRL